MVNPLLWSGTYPFFVATGIATGITNQSVTDIRPWVWFPWISIAGINRMTNLVYAWHVHWLSSWESTFCPSLGQMFKHKSTFHVLGLATVCWTRRGGCLMCREARASFPKLQISIVQIIVSSCGSCCNLICVLYLWSHLIRWLLPNQLQAIQTRQTFYCCSSRWLSGSGGWIWSARGNYTT